MLDCVSAQEANGRKYLRIEVLNCLCREIEAERTGQEPVVQVSPTEHAKQEWHEQHRQKLNQGLGPKIAHVQ
jgi:hypothetical protein